VAAALESYVTESIALLIVIAALAGIVLVVARRAGLGKLLGPVELLARLPLEARRSVYVVRVVDRVLILGASEAGLVKLGELDKDAVGSVGAEPRSTFASVLEAVWRGPSGALSGASADAASSAVAELEPRPSTSAPHGKGAAS
jgi:flagellar biogenesis protein FliO